MAGERGRLWRLTAVAVVVSALCIAAGVWQWQRAKDAIDLERADSAAPIAVLDGADVDGFPAISVGREAYVTGTYAAGQEFVGPRMLADRTGWWVLTPLISEGQTIAVLRGWVSEPDDPAAAIPEGTVTVRGTLQPFEDFYADRPRGTDGRLVAVSRPEVEADWATPVVSLVLFIDEQQPPADPGLQPVPPSTGQGDVPFPWQNAAYTVQWFAFAGFAWFAWWMWAIRGRRDDADSLTE